MIQNVANIAQRNPRSRRTANPYIAGANGEKKIFRHPQSVLPRKPTTMPQIHPTRLSKKTEKNAILHPIISDQFGGMSCRIWPSDSPSSCRLTDSLRLVTKYFNGCSSYHFGLSANTPSKPSVALEPLILIERRADIGVCEASCSGRPSPGAIDFD